MNKNDCKSLTVALLKTAKYEFFIDSFFKVMKAVFSVLVLMCFALKVMKAMK